MSLPSLQQLLQQRRAADFPVAIHAGQPVGWHRFVADAAGFAALAARLPAGSAVALFDEQAYPVAAALFGLWAAGCIPVLPSNATPVTQARLQARVADFWGGFEGGRPLALPSLASSSPPPPAVQLASLPASARLELFTSGSTGSPKPVGKRIVQLDAELQSLECAFGAGLAGLPVLATVSHQHIYGLLFKVLWPLAAGRVFDSRLWRDSGALARHAEGLPGGAIWVASPAHLKRLGHDYPWAAAGAGIREVFSSGGPLPEAAAAQWHQGWGRAPLEVYGSTETGGIGWRRQSDDGGWQPLPGVEIGAATAPTMDSADDMEGTLRLRSPHLPDRNWLVLDDKGRLREDGRFELTGRRDRIVKIEEKRLSLPELEALLDAHPLLSESTALMLGGDRPKLAVVAVPSEAGAAMLATRGRAATIRQLRRDLAAAFEVVVLPRRWRFVAALPFNSQGKLERTTLIALFEDAPDAAGAPAGDMEEKAAGEATDEVVRLPEILHSRVSGRTVELGLRVPTALSCLAGHFPGQPILPGVVQIDWAVHFARELLDPEARFAGMENIKFRLLTRPGRDLTLHLEHDPVRGRLTFRYQSGAGVHSSGRILLADAS